MNIMTVANAARIALALATLTGAVLPAGAVNVNFSGTLVLPPPCTINSGNDIAVPFGTDLVTTNVDGVNYEKPIGYTLDCTGTPSNNLKLQLQGIGAGFDTTVLSTDKPDLGIELRRDGVKLPVNTWLNFINPGRPVLTAVPVKRSGSTLTTGSFAGKAVFMVDYQ